MSLPYEKMYLIDEADYLQLKTGNALPPDDDDIPALTLQLDETLPNLALAQATSSPKRGEPELDLESLLILEDEIRQQQLHSLSDMDISEIQTLLNETESTIANSSLNIERLEEEENQARARIEQLENERRRAQEEELQQRLAEEQAQEVAELERIAKEAEIERQQLVKHNKQLERMQLERQQHEFLMGLRRAMIDKHYADVAQQRAAAHIVDLDADLNEPREQVALLKRVFPNPVLAQMNIKEQVEATQELLNKTPQEVQDISDDLYETFQSEVGNTLQYDSDESIIGLARSQGPPTLKKQQVFKRHETGSPIHSAEKAQTVTMFSPIKKKVRFDDEPPTPKPKIAWKPAIKLKEPKTAKEPTKTAKEPTKIPIEPGKKAPRAARGNQNDKMQRLYVEFEKLGIIGRGGSELNHPTQLGRAMAISFRDLLARLISESHTQLKSAPPDGLEWMYRHAVVRPQILALVGERFRRDFRRIYPDIKVPKKIPLVTTPKKIHKPVVQVKVQKPLTKIAPRPMLYESLYND